MSSYARNPLGDDIKDWLASVRAWFKKRRYTRAERYVLKLFAKHGAKIRADEQRAAAQAMISTLQEQGVRPLSREGKARLEQLVLELIRDKTPLARRRSAAPAKAPKRSGAKQVLAESVPATVESVALSLREELGLTPARATRLAERQIAVRDRSRKRAEERVRAVREEAELKKQKRQREEQKVPSRRPPGPPKRRTDTPRQTDAAALAALGPVTVTPREATEKKFEETKDEAARPAPQVFDKRPALGPPGTSSTALARREAGVQTLARRAESALEETGLAVRDEVTDLDIATAADRYGEQGTQALVRELEGAAQPCVVAGREGLCVEFLDGLPAFFIDLDWHRGEIALVHLPSSEARFGESRPAEDEESFAQDLVPIMTFARPDESVVDAVAAAKVASEIFGPAIHRPLLPDTIKLLSTILLAGSDGLETWMKDLSPNTLYSVYDFVAELPRDYRQQFADEIAESQIGLTHAFLVMTRSHGPRLEELLWIDFNLSPYMSYLEMLTNEQADIVMRSPSLREVSGFDADLKKVRATRKLQLGDRMFERYREAVEDNLELNLSELARVAEDAGINWQNLESRALIIDELSMDQVFASDDDTAWVGSEVFTELFQEEGLAFSEIAGRFMSEDSHHDQITAFIGGRWNLPEVLQKGQIGRYADAVSALFALSNGEWQSSIADNIEALVIAVDGEYDYMPTEINRRYSDVLSEAFELTGKRIEFEHPLPDYEEVVAEAEEFLEADFNELMEGIFAEGDLDRDDEWDYEKAHEIVREGEAWQDMLSNQISEVRVEALETIKNEMENQFIYYLPFTAFEFASVHVTELASDGESAVTLASLLGQVLALMGRESGQRQFVLDAIPYDADEVLSALRALPTDDAAVPNLAFSFLQHLSEGD